MVNTALVVADAFANTSEGSAMVPQYGEWLGSPVAVLRAEPEAAARPQPQARIGPLD